MPANPFTLADLADELIHLRRDLDAATAEAATAVAILQRRSAELLQRRVFTFGGTIGRAIGVDGLLADDDENVVRVFRRLREVSIAVLCLAGIEVDARDGERLRARRRTSSDRRA